MAEARGLKWRTDAATKRRVFRDGDCIAEVSQDSTPSGPRWFARALPSRGLCSPAQGRERFVDAVTDLHTAVDQGEV